MSKPIAVSDSEFQSQVKDAKGLVLVDFWAEWCGPCRALTPTLEELAVDYESKVKITKVNVDENRETAASFQVRSIPTMILFKDGEVVDQVMGNLPKADLSKLFDKHL